MDIINEIKKKLKSRGLTQKEFAKLIDMHPSKLSDVFQGRRPLRLEFITACLKIFPELELNHLTNLVKEPTEVYERSSEDIIREIRILLDELAKKLGDRPENDPNKN